MGFASYRDSWVSADRFVPHEVIPAWDPQSLIRSRLIPGYMVLSEARPL
jgi:hypothetical protein